MMKNNIARFKRDISLFVLELLKLKAEKKESLF